MDGETIKIRYPVPSEFLYHIVDSHSHQAICNYFQDMYGVTPLLVLPDDGFIVVHLPPCKESTMLALKYPIPKRNR